MLLLPAVASGQPQSNKIHHCEALTLLKALPSNSVDMVFADIPYGVHEMDWDTLPDLPTLMTEFKRVIKPRRAIVMTAQQPLTTDLINAARDWFKYLWMWDKGYSTDLFNARNRPMRRHEDVLVFSSGTTANRSPNRMLYNPQGLVQAIRDNGRGDHGTPFKRGVENKVINTRKSWKKKHFSKEANFPHSILHFFEGVMNRINPNQKPVALLEYLIRTYTNEGDLVIDTFMGSGTTAIAARNTERSFVGCDTDLAQVIAARQRLLETDGYLDKELKNGLKQKSLFAVAE